MPHRKIIKTGLPSFDDILGGGLTSDRVYLIHGNPGSGKTTLSMQFLLEGARNKEKVLYITLSETKMELESVSQSHGWSLDGIDIFEIIAQEQDLDTENQYTMYQPSELELNVTTAAIMKEVERLKPSRVVIDSLTEIKLQAQSALRFRRQVLALKQFFIGRGCTVFLLDDKTSAGQDDLQLQSIAHGVLSLEQLSPEYGAERRRICITKLRGQQYRGGHHDFTITRGGVSIFPRIVPAEHVQKQEIKKISSGIPNIDTLLGGGVEQGTSVLLLGPAGIGKSSLGIQYAVTAAARGERSVIFAFDERLETMLIRTRGIGMELEKYMKAGLISVRAIDPVEMSPGEFADCVRKEVAEGENKVKASIVIIDSLNGYLNAMPEERFLIAQLHELLTYLGHHGVVSFLVVAQHGLLGTAIQNPIDTSYLADVVIFFRYFEVIGEVRQAISVVKKRAGNHERTVREFKVSNKGLGVSDVLREFHGVLTGTPILTKVESKADNG